LDVPALPAAPVLACLAAVAGAGLAAWLTAWAETWPGLRTGIGAAFAAGAVAVVCARALPVHVARDETVMAGGRSLAGAVVRVEYADRARPWPGGVSARGHVLWGNGEVGRGVVLNYTGDPVRHLRGG
jgi:hypothetical protein